MEDHKQLLVVDDDPLILDCFRFLYPKDSVAVRTAATAAEGLKRYAEQVPDALILDVRLPDLHGLEAVRSFQRIDAKVPIILITGHGCADVAIEAMRLGAFEYVVKPVELVPLRQLLNRAFEISRLRRVPAKLLESPAALEPSELLVGNCPAMQEIYKAIGRVSPQDVTVLIRGESGTGKELAARAVYHYSKRSQGPFLAINCAAIPEALLESELFGHEKGSFTGADRKRIGKFEQCNGGTLFLDEIGDMTPLTQTKILRVLQDKQFQRVGGNEIIQTDVRIIAATNQNLEARMADGRFRADLYFRLNEVNISLPPLRERNGDVQLLAEHFLRRFSQKLSKDVVSMAPEALDRLRRYSWPGNVREMQSVIKQAILQASGPTLGLDALPDPIRSADRPAAKADMGFNDLTRFIDDSLRAGSINLHAEFQAMTERQLLLQVLRHTGTNLSRAARILGISRTTLRSKLSGLGVAVERSTTLDEETVF